MSDMRAKMRVSQIQSFETSADPPHKQAEKCLEVIKFHAVAASAYPADGTDENNSYAKWTPSAECQVSVTNPRLWDKFKEGQEYYVDFTLAGK